jgi:hypothetical protein
MSFRPLKTATATITGELASLDWVKFNQKNRIYHTVGFSDADFIAAGTNDNTIVQQAVDLATIQIAATNGIATIHIKSGDYSYSSAVIVTTSNIRIIHDQDAKITLANAANSSIYTIGDGVTLYSNVSLENLYLDGNLSNQTLPTTFATAYPRSSVYVRKQKNFNITVNRIENAVSYGIFIWEVNKCTGSKGFFKRIGPTKAQQAIASNQFSGDAVFVYQDCQDVEFSEMKCEDARRIGFTVDATINTKSTNIKFIDCEAYGTNPAEYPDHGFHAENADDVLFIRCKTSKFDGGIFNTTVPINLGTISNGAGITFGRACKNPKAIDCRSEDGLLGFLSYSESGTVLPSGNAVTVNPHFIRCDSKNMDWGHISIREASSNPSDDKNTAKVIDCTLEGATRTGFDPGGEGVYVSKAKLAHVRGNTIRNVRNGIYIAGSLADGLGGSVIVTNNIIDSATNYGVYNNLSVNDSSIIDHNIITNYGLGKVFSANPTDIQEPYKYTPPTQGTVALSGTINSTGTLVTFSDPFHARQLTVGIFLKLTSGAQSGEVRQVTAINTFNTVTLDYAYSANQTGTSTSRSSVGGTGAITTVGTAATIATGTTSQFRVGEYIQISTGAQSGEERQIASITNATQFVLTSAFSGDQISQNFEFEVLNILAIEGEHFILVNANATAHTSNVRLPSAINNNARYIIQKRDSTAKLVNIVPSVIGQTINSPAVFKTLSTIWTGVTIISTGANYQYIEADPQITVTLPFWRNLSGAVDGTNTVFTLPVTPTSPDHVVVKLNATIQTRVSDYNISGTTVTFVSAPLTGDTIQAYV